MPQLMPLPWLISFMMVMFFVFSASMIYSSFILNFKVNVKLGDKNLFMWLW